MVVDAARSVGQVHEDAGTFQSLTGGECQSWLVSYQFLNSDWLFTYCTVSYYYYIRQLHDGCNTHNEFGRHYSHEVDIWQTSKFIHHYIFPPPLISEKSEHQVKMF